MQKSVFLAIFYISLCLLISNYAPANTSADKVWQGELNTETLDKFAQGNYNLVKGNVYIVNFNGQDLRSLKHLKRVEGDFYIGNYQNPKNTVEGKIKLLNELQSTLVEGHMFSDLTEDEKRRLASHLSRDRLIGFASNKKLVPRTRKDREYFIDAYGNPAPNHTSANIKDPAPKGGNPKLASLAGLENLEQVTGWFKISDNAILRDLKGVAKLISVAALVITENPALISLDGIKSLHQTTSKYTGILLGGNPKLQHIKALANLSKTSDIHLYDNASLRSLDGLQKITHLSDGLFIKGACKFTNFDGLNNLESIKGDLTITKASELSSFKGLEKLISTGDFSLEKSPKINNLIGLKALQNIDGDLSITKNAGLTSLQGLDNLTTIKREFYVRDNPKLAQINSLQNVVNIKKLHINLPLDPKAFAKVKTLKRLHFSIGNAKESAPLPASISAKGWLANVKEVEHLSFAHAIPIDFKDALPKLKKVTQMGLVYMTTPELYGPNSLEYIKEVGMSNNNGLQRITGFANLKRIDELRIQENKNMPYFRAFDALEELGIVWIEKNDDMEDLAGFSALKVAKSVNIRENKVLKSISGFKQLAQVQQTLWLDENPELIDLSGFTAVTKVKELYIDENSKLTHLSGFQSLGSVGSLRISRNRLLADLSGLEQLQKAKFVRIEYNENIQALAGLDKLQEVVGLTVAYNDKLTSLHGLEKLTKIKGGELVFKENDALVSLHGLDGLKVMDKGVMVLRKNQNLNNFDGLPLNFLQTIRDTQLIVDGNADNISLEELLFSRTLNSVKLHATQLQGKNLHTLSLLRNTLFARKGYNQFGDELSQHFNKKGWYKPVDGEYKATLTDLEEHNIKLILNAEKAIKQRIKHTVLAMRQSYKQGIADLGEFGYLEKTLQSFINHINIKALLKSKSLSYSDQYFIQNDGCKNTLKIAFNPHFQPNHFSIYVEHCGFKANAKNCHLRIKDAKQGQFATDFIGNGCYINIEEADNTNSVLRLDYSHSVDGTSFELLEVYDEYE